MRSALVILGVAGLMLTGCGRGAEDGANVAASDNRSDALPPISAPCADDGGRLPITGICSGRAVNYLNIAPGAPPEPPEGCEWVVQETRFASDVLLYRATKCGEKTTKLAYAPGAGLAELSYETLAYGDPEGRYKGSVVVHIGPSDRTEPTAALLRIARDAVPDPVEKARCKVRNADIDVWPQDALVVDMKTVAEARQVEDGPRAACGAFGFNGDEAAYWRVFQGRSWFFQLGQDATQIDSGSFTLMTKGSDGSWTMVP